MAAGVYLAVLPKQRSHFGGAQDDPVAMWTVLEAAHVKRRPGARFNAYNSLFSLCRNDDKMLSSLASCVEESMCTMQNLCLQCSLIRALPNIYTFVNALLLKDKLDKATILNAFQNDKIYCFP